MTKKRPGIEVLEGRDMQQILDAVIGLGIVAKNKSNDSFIRAQSEQAAYCLAWCLGMTPDNSIMQLCHEGLERLAEQGKQYRERAKESN